MDSKIVVHGRIPSKKNSTITMCRNNRALHFPSNAYRDWHKVVSLQLPKTPIPAIIELTILFFLPDNRKTDLTNKAESVMDLLVDNNILEDDNWTVIPRLILQSGGVDKLNPRAEITWQEPKNTKQ